MRDDFNVRPADHRYTDSAKHKEEQGIGGSEAKTQTKGLGADAKGRKMGEIKQPESKINFPKASDSQYDSELGPPKTAKNKTYHGQKGWQL